ncbi:putative phage terminase large subunit-like protein [Methylobacterium sp. BE186]|uniref:phage terminase large subunit n=1 Tax=Methylobacterium sp. BE186 TaxID=2817715 RepID=UPI00285F34DC|nr:phage terminase large subunit [Methylobacterium sp. BE186]MDR7037390.1 putative phage terminase large subunit-like protein [Methylobacterium sp. BE186]
MTVGASPTLATLSSLISSMPLADRETLRGRLEAEASLRAKRRSFTEFCRQAGYVPAPHHKILVKQLERLSRGEIRKLMVFMPPGSAKSTYTSILFPAWHLAQSGTGNVIAASHSSELAERFGRKVRGLVTDHSTFLGYGISAESSAAGRWETTTGREYLAAGVGVGIAGFRSALSLIDDPFRSRQDADSKLIRDRVWDWYNDDLDTRLVPGGRQALVMTRWHEDDLAGRLLERESDWEVISIAAEALPGDPLGRQPGEWLWEGEYGYADRLREKKANTDARSWSALYQQQPTPDSGAYFERDWIKPAVSLPPRDDLRVYGASDYAVTKDGGDYTVHIVIGIDYDGRLYVLDLWRGQTDSSGWIEAWCDLVVKWQPYDWAEEGGQIRAALGPYLEQRAIERRAYTTRHQFPSRHDKSVRAQSIRARMSMGGLYVPAQAPWRSDFVSELMRFPAGVHDDQVDALGLVGQLLDQIQPPTRAQAEEAKRRRRDYGEDEDDDMGVTNWKAA